MNRDMLIIMNQLVLFAMYLIVGYVLLFSVFTILVPSKYLPNIVSYKDHNCLRLQEVKQTSNVDLLFLGSSHAYRGFDTRVFETYNYKVFNLGSSSQTPKQTYVLLKRYLKQLNPKLIVYEVNPIMFTSDGTESAVNLISTDDTDLYSLQMVIDQKNIKVLNSFIHTVLQSFREDSSAVKIDNYQKGGYVSSDHPFLFKGKPQEEETIKFRISQVKKFESILQIFEESDLDYILVQAPITSLKYDSYTNMEWFNNKMQTYGDYYDFNNQLNLNDTIHFYDSHHLNQEGVNIFNEHFIEQLNRKYPKLKN